MIYGVDRGMLAAEAGFGEDLVPHEHQAADPGAFPAVY
jgi:Na+/alanine symporter